MARFVRTAARVENLNRFAMRKKHYALSDALTSLAQELHRRQAEINAAEVNNAVGNSVTSVYHDDEPYGGASEPLSIGRAGGTGSKRDASILDETIIPGSCGPLSFG